MKFLFKLLLIAFLFTCNFSFGQNEKPSFEYSFFLSNGISNHINPNNFGEELNTIYVNSLRLQMAFGKSERYRFVLGLQYGAYGGRYDWVCDSGFCDTYGVPPIQVETIERFRLASLIFNPRYMFPKKYYFQGGLSLDVPFAESLRSTYISSDGVKTKLSEFGFKGDRAIFNTTFGVNLIFGKQFTINEKWNWNIEIEGKMYNFIAVRFEDFEDYFLDKKQKPWVIGINLGISFH